MSDILQIGKSGLLAAQTAIEMTGQNIANAGTEGYLRREAVTRERIASDGVEVRDIRRAFDALLNARLLDARSAHGAAAAFDVHARELETLMLADQNGIDDGIAALFDGFDALAQSPEDAGLRRAVVQAGEALAGRVRDLAHVMDARSALIEAERDVLADQATAHLDALAKIETQLSATTDVMERNPLLDLREKTLSDLAQIVPITPSKDPADRLTVTLGAGPGGAVLLDGGQAGRIEASPEGRVTAFAAGNPSNATSWRPTGGSLGGLADAAGIVGDARRDVDDWAATVATDLNTAHAQGITVNGADGGALFLTSGWDGSAGVLNRGEAVASVAVTDEAAMPAGPLTLVRDAGTSEWQAFDGAGTLLGAGDTAIALPGLDITLSGSALNGDRITLERRDADAGALRFVLNSGDEIATGGRFDVTPDPANSGFTTLTASGTPPAAPRDFRVLDADARQIGFFDSASGAQLGTATLDGASQVSFEGMTARFAGALVTGDSFSLAANPGEPGDARTAAALASLRQFDAETGTGGFASAFAGLRLDAGAAVASGEIRLTAADASAEGAMAAIAARGGVNLDEEAARLLAQQQAYQANARVISVAGEVFDTLMRSI